MSRRAMFCLAICLFASLRSSAQDRSTPEAAVRTFVSAVVQADMTKAATCVKGVALRADGLAAMSMEIKKEPVVITLNELKTDLKGTTAVVSGKGTIKSPKGGKADAFDTSLNLASVDGAWQIVPDKTKAMKDDHDVLNMFAYLLTDANIFQKANDSAKATLCLSNMKQLGTAAMMLAMDYHEKYEMKPATFSKSLTPYTKNKSIFKCPSDSGSSPSYSLNANLAGVAVERVHSPATTVLFYEGANGKLNYRHDGRAVVCFADGHVKFVTAADSTKLRWKP